MASLVSWRFVAAALLVLCAFLANRLLDQGLTATYNRASIETSAQRIELLKGLIHSEWIGLGEDAVMKRLQAYVDANPSKMIVLTRDVQSNEIVLEGIAFRFKNQRLDAVE
ncbi:Imm58 family immunity protein [Mitsuaria sp. GD03876]|uniref:Imm58 family immunity protein n=1 Tax=Mitsuaria sp. GD03876 TaxID=2975399 RepID=UPI00244B4D70|nr:Imm58 family immunity protein [Mitsuaria sp. GD03876]MDH0863547.1 Imm58 family immunity protein [Mitsuaria sp. GD03876]